MVQTTFAVAKIWYLFDNAKYFSSHVRYNHKISCISEEIEHVQKWTFSIAISISPKSIIALKRLTLLAFRKSSNVISAFCIIPLSNSAALFVPGNKGCLGVTQCLPSIWQGSWMRYPLKVHVWRWWCRHSFLSVRPRHWGDCGRYFCSHTLSCRLRPLEFTIVPEGDNIKIQRHKMATDLWCKNEKS